MACKLVFVKMALGVFLVTVVSIPARASVWIQTDWSGGQGQLSWSDTTMYYTGTQVNGWTSPGDLALTVPDDASWVNTGNLAGATVVYSVIEASDGVLYAGTGSNGDVFISVDAGTTWVNTENLVGASYVYSFIEAFDGALYAGTGPYGDVFKSADAGTTWVNTGDLTGASYVRSLIEASDGVFYAGTGSNGDVFMSVDVGTTWVNTGDLDGAAQVWSLIEASDGVLYAGTYDDTAVTYDNVFKSVDAGTTWVNTGDLAGATRALSLTQASDGALYAGTSNNGDVFRSGYFLSGDMISSVYETENTSVSFGVMIWDETLNTQAIAMRVRTDTLPDMSTAADWDTCPPVVNGQDISDLSSVDDNERYIQYRVEFSTSRSDVTPVLHEVSIEYEIGIEQEVKSRSSISRYQLLQTRPNPVHRTAVIRYLLADAEENVPVFLGLYDLAGRLVRPLVDKRQGAGVHQVRWDVKNDPSGVYFYRLKAGEFTDTKKMVIID